MSALRKTVQNLDAIATTILIAEDVAANCDPTDDMHVAIKVCLCILFI
jgi:hypothetical protein